MTSTIPNLSNFEEWPSVPTCADDLRIPAEVVHDIILRYIWTHGSASLSTLQKTLKLPFAVLEEVCIHLRDRQLLEVKQAIGRDYIFALTQRGRDKAAARMEVCQYAGPVPVSLPDYERVVRAQAAVVELNRDLLREALNDLVLPDELLDQLGPSLIAHRSLFLYGDTGSGKSSIAQRILRIYQDPVVVPYAITVDGQIIAVLDPHVHKLVRFAGDNLDARWVVCQRPCVKVGGELTSAMLELGRDEASRVFTAPCQVKANNGILIVDDFGRQLVSPRELLNRWIVALDQRVDFLTLASGMKFQVPFEQMLVFSTNLDPTDLVDEAFLRRIHTKVLVKDVTPEAFDRIFEQVATAEQMPFDGGSAEHLRRRCLDSGSGFLRACYPKDICNLVKATARYEGRAAAINAEEIDRAIDLYFAKPAQARLARGGTPTA